MDAKILEKAGLTSGEAKVYRALLESGTATIGDIAKKAIVSPSKIYDVIARLGRKGLILQTGEETKKYYRAANPKQLLEYMGNTREQLQQREEEVKAMLPSLEMMYKEKESVEIFQGIAGIKRLFEMALEQTKKRETIFLLGYPKQASAIFSEYNKEYHKRRAEANVKMKIIYNKESWFWKKRERRMFVETKYLPENIITPAFLIIFNNTVGNIIVTENQKTCIVIQNKEIAESYKKYFEMLWKQAVSP